VVLVLLLAGCRFDHDGHVGTSWVSAQPRGVTIAAGATSVVS
jgi:hypothetical protein